MLQTFVILYNIENLRDLLGITFNNTMRCEQIRMYSFVMTSRIIYTNNSVYDWLTLTEDVDKDTKNDCWVRNGRQPCLFERLMFSPQRIDQSGKRCDFFDLSSALDCVHHNLLSEKLFNIGIPQERILFNDLIVFW